ncbi:hypothetical protein GCM10010169_44370 [Micromonospora fulviviridis]|nr:hypothetical protein GCM10010169_44370 [Micromonospora fulviviridis]
MRPPRRPRDRLARLLRATADRLATAAATPPRALPPEPAPRRPGEPPEHWLRLVAAHAPNLLQTLPTPTPPASPVDQEVCVGSDGSADANFLINEEGAEECGHGGVAGVGGGGGRGLPLRPAVPGLDWWAGRVGGATGSIGGTVGAVAGGLSGLGGGSRPEVDPGRIGVLGPGTRADPRGLAEPGAPAGDSSRYPVRSGDDIPRAPSSGGAAGGGSTSSGRRVPRSPLAPRWESAATGAARGSVVGLPGAASSDGARRGRRSDDGVIPPSRPAVRASRSPVETDAPPGWSPGRTSGPSGSSPGRTGAPPESSPRMPGRARSGWDTVAGSAAEPGMASRARSGWDTVASNAAEPGMAGRAWSGWDTVAGSAAEPGMAGRTGRVHPATAGDPPVPVVPLADTATGRVRPGPSVGAPELSSARTAASRGGAGTGASDELRVRLLSLGRQQTHPNPLAAAIGDGSTGRPARGTAGPGPAPDRPDWTAAAAGPWPALPREAGDTGLRGAQPHGTAGVPRRDPWPALPDDRGLWAPAVTARDADRLARLDREQAGD